MGVEKVASQQQISEELDGLELQARRGTLQRETVRIAKKEIDYYADQLLQGVENLHFWVWRFLPFFYSAERKAKFEAVQRLFDRIDAIAKMKVSALPAPIFEERSSLRETVLSRLGNSTELLVKIIPHVDERGYFHKPDTKDEFDREKFEQLDRTFLGRKDELEAACIGALKQWKRPLSADRPEKAFFPKAAFINCAVKLGHLWPR